MLKTLELKDLSCGACAATIRTALDINGFTSVRVDLLSKPHSVTAEVASSEQLDLLKSVLREHGYPLYEDKIEESIQTEFNFS